MLRTYLVVSGVFFGLIAVLQALRALNRVPVQIGHFAVPVRASWIAAIVTAGLCFWAFRSMT
jgi:hypothetical protein